MDLGLEAAPPEGPGRTPALAALLLFSPGFRPFLALEPAFTGRRELARSGISGRPAPGAVAALGIQGARLAPLSLGPGSRGPDDGYGLQPGGLGLAAPARSARPQARQQLSRAGMAQPGSPGGE